jgi:Glycosyl transferases group 1
MQFACILDDFSYLGFSSVCLLESCRPNVNILHTNFDFLFVESAWFGVDGLWAKNISSCSPALIELVVFFKNIGLPTVFWCKEDPVHFHRFLEAASLFDFVFTSDINCISKYKKLLGHSRVYLMPFAFDSLVSNPIEILDRKSLAAYAGSYYVRYPYRSSDLLNIFNGVSSVCGLDIYDRYHNSIDINYRFPHKYQQFIKGSLSPDQIDIAYKGYTYGINLNTVKNSESMFARRVFELLGSGTVVISNESPGIRFLFGDLVITSDNADEIRQQLQELVDDPVLRSKVALAGVRKVLLEHTYAHRLERVYSIVFCTPEKKQTLPSVCVLASISSVTEMQRLQQMLLSQKNEVDWHAVLALADGAGIASMREAITDERITCVSFASAAQQGMAVLLADAQWAAGWNVNDYYGPNYLLDLLLGTRYCDAPVLGKAALFCADSSGPKWVNQEAVYKPTAHLQARCALMKPELLDGVSVAEFMGFVASRQPLPEAIAEGAMALDAFSYCQDAWLQGLAQADVSAVVDDFELNKGRSIDELYAKAEALPVRVPAWLGKPAWRIQNLAQAFGTANEGATLHGTLDKFGWHLVSEIADGNHAFIWAVNAVPIEELGGYEGLKFHVVEGPGLPIELMVRFETERGNLLAEEMFETNQNQQWSVPIGCTHIRLGFRVFSSGTTRIMRFVLNWI